MYKTQTCLCYIISRDEFYWIYIAILSVYLYTHKQPLFYKYLYLVQNA